MLGLSSILISQCRGSKDHLHEVSDSKEVRNDKSLAETPAKDVSVFYKICIYI